MNTLATSAIGWAERGLIPDSLVRAGIRLLLRIPPDDDTLVKHHERTDF